MAVSALWYGLGVKAMLDGTINWASDTIKVAAATSAYTPNQDTDQFFSSITEATGDGYTAGGVTLADKTSSYDAASNNVMLDAADISWPNPIALTFRYLIVYKSTGTAGTSPLLGYVDFGADQTTTTGPINVTWNASGVMYGNAAAAA